VLVYFVDAESRYGWQLKELLAGQGFLDIESIFSRTQLNYFCSDGNQYLPKSRLKQMAEEVLDAILPGQRLPKAGLLDERIVEVIEFVDSPLAKPSNSLTSPV